MLVLKARSLTHLVGDNFHGDEVVAAPEQNKIVVSKKAKQCIYIILFGFSIPPRSPFLLLFFELISFCFLGAQEFEKFWRNVVSGWGRGCNWGGVTVHVHVHVHGGDCGGGVSVHVDLVNPLRFLAGFHFQILNAHHFPELNSRHVNEHVRTAVRSDRLVVASEHVILAVAVVEHALLANFRHYLIVKLVPTCVGQILLVRFRINNLWADVHVVVPRVHVARVQQHAVEVVLLVGDWICAELSY